MLGLSKPVHIFQLGASVEEMVNMTAIGLLMRKKSKKKQLWFSRCSSFKEGFNYYILIR
jgi:malate dehydrogenase (oxaloacetate-decarboxylating)(NADP+)